MQLDQALRDFRSMRGRLRKISQSPAVFLLFHLAPASYLLGATGDPIVIASVWFVMQFGVHGGYHRYFAHRSFSTYSWFAFLLALTGCLSYQNGPIWWSSKHRRHHQVADTAEDHHSPATSFWHAHMGWLWVEGASDIEWRFVADLRQPMTLWVEENQPWILGIYAAGVFLLGGWSAVVNWWLMPVIICWHTTFSTNSFCHLFGSHERICRPRETCNARNNALIAILNLGEGWHNNHHANPAISHHGFYRWYQIDIVYGILVVLEALGVVWNVRRARR